MPINKVEMSLDDIIKANKNENKGKNAKGKFGGKANKSLQGTKRRQISKQSPKNRGPKGKIGKGPIRGGKGGVINANKATAVTKQLVQKLVKKALAQSNIGRNRTIGMATNSQRGKIRGGRIVKKTVVLNRLKISPRSRVIARRRVVPQKIVNVRRRPIQYQQTYTVQQPVVRRVNFVKNNARRPVIVRQQPRTIIVQERQQNYRRGNFSNGRGRSIRQHINQMRQGYAMTAPRQQQQVRVIRQTTFVQPRPQRNRQQRNNFGNRGQRKVQYDPMYEPPNFLQRIPSQNSAGGRRFVQF